MRIFRGDSSLSVGDKLTFHVNVCRPNDQIPCGPAYIGYDTFLQARYLETFLNGIPPSVAAVDLGLISSAPTEKPQLQASRLAYALERLKWALR